MRVGRFARDILQKMPLRRAPGIATGCPQASGGVGCWLGSERVALVGVVSGGGHRTLLTRPRSCYLIKQCAVGLKEVLNIKWRLMKSKRHRRMR